MYYIVFLTCFIPAVRFVNYHVGYCLPNLKPVFHHIKCDIEVCIPSSNSLHNVPVCIILSYLLNMMNY